MKGYSKMRSFFGGYSKMFFSYDLRTKTEETSRHASEDSINSFSGSSRKTHFEGSILDTTSGEYMYVQKGLLHARSFILPTA